MIQLHKWFPFVFPTQYDVKAVAIEKRAERIEYEYQQQLKAEKLRIKVDEFDLELYNKRARQASIELEIFSNKRNFDKYV